MVQLRVHLGVLLGSPVCRWLVMLWAHRTWAQGHVSGAHRVRETHVKMETAICGELSNKDHDLAD